jgi:hypothetical protein
VSFGTLPWGGLGVGAAPAAPDVLPPVISNFSPPVGTTIDTLQPVSFNVTDTGGAFRRIIVTAVYPRTGIEEVVHDGATFVGRYLTASQRSIIANGFSFSVMRAGGWPSSPTIRVFAFDIAGNEAS